MEYPNLGEHCSSPSCKTLDFLPFTCAYCNLIFCKEHFNQSLHNCKSLGRGTSNNVDIKSFACSHVDCNQISPLEMLCPKCQKHFCLLHRYHNCFDVVEDIEEKKRLWNTPREQFAASVKAVDKMVNY